MRTVSSLLAALLLSASCLSAAAPEFSVGASHFFFTGGQPDARGGANSVNHDNSTAPFVAVTQPLSDRVALRLSYHYIDGAETTAEFWTFPGSMLPYVVYGRYGDDIHLVSLAPEFKWKLGARLQIAVAPQLNWVASKGMVSYSSTNPAILLVGPQTHRDDGFTAGGAVRGEWSLGQRSSVTLGYSYVDLDPSFDRTAHVLSGGFSWRF